MKRDRKYEKTRFFQKSRRGDSRGRGRHMGIGILLMLLQAVATFFKDLAKARGEKIS